MASRTAAIVPAIVSGALVATQANVSARLGRSVGTFQAATIHFGLGLVVLVAVMFLFGGGAGGLAKIGRVPPWALLGGAMGAANVAIGLLAVRVLVAGQLTLAVVIDRFDVFGFGRLPPERGVTRSMPRASSASCCWWPGRGS